MIILGLGTNIGDRLDYLQRAVIYLGEKVLDITAISPIYESPALLKPNAPKDWNSAFLNMAIMGETNLTPQALLLQIKSIEKKIGRQYRGIWAPREIDIDILAYENLNIDESDLKIPHNALLVRDFALLPFADIAPNWRYPKPGKYNGKTAHEIASMEFSANKTAVKTKLRLDLQKNSLVS